MFSTLRKGSRVVYTSNICHQPEQNEKQTAKMTPDQTPRVVHHRGKKTNHMCHCNQKY